MIIGKLLKWMVGGLVRVMVRLAHLAYRIEGINVLLLFMPAKLIVPTLRRYGAHIGDEVIIHSPLIIHNAKDGYGHLNIGDRCYLGRLVFLDLKEPITLEARVTLSMKTTLITHTDAGESPVSDVLKPSQAPVHIHAGAYLGANVTVLQGVRVGENAVVGAGSLVTRDVPPRTVAAGSPARVLRSLDA